MRKSTVLSFVISLLVVGFVMIAPSLAQDTTLTYGDTVTGEITNENYEVPFTFQGTAGDVILVEMTMLEEGLDSYLQLKDASGEVIFFDDDGGVGVNSALGPITLPEDGTYTIVATRYMQAEGTSQGAFELTLSMASITEIVLNESVTVTLDAQQTRTTYQYVTDGSIVLKFVGEISIFEETAPAINVIVNDSEGNWVTSGYIDQENNILIDPLYLPKADTYMISIVREPSFDNMGNPQPIEDSVTVQFEVSTVELQPMEIGDTVSGTVSIGEFDYYTFSADAGTIVRLEGNQPEGEAPFDVMLYNNSGNQFTGAGIPQDGQSTSFTYDPIRLDMGNDYLMVVRQTNYSMSPVEGVSNYTVTLSLSGTPALESGVEVTGTVGGDTYEQVYRYEGSAGQLIRLTVASANRNYAPSISIDGDRPEDAEETGYWGYIGNAGSILPGTVTYEVTLPQDGVYLIHVSNGRNGADGPLVGRYNLLLEVVE